MSAPFRWMVTAAAVVAAAGAGLWAGQTGLVKLPMHTSRAVVAGAAASSTENHPLPQHTTHSRSDRGDRRQLRIEHGLVELPSRIGRTTDVHSTGPIRAITGEYNTKIADHEPAPGNTGGRCPSMDNQGTGSEARIVGKDIPSAPARRASYSMAAATSISVAPGWIFLQAV